MLNIKKKLFHYIKEILLFLVVISLFANALSFYKSSELNKKALSIKSVTLLNQQEYHIQKERPLLVHFWASWCPTCKLEADNIQRISQQYNVLTFAVTSGSNEEIQSYLKEHNLDFKVVNDRNSYYASEFKISGFPTTFIYDKNQNLVFSDVGYTSTLGLFLRMWWASII